MKRSFHVLILIIVISIALFGARHLEKAEKTDSMIVDFTAIPLTFGSWQGKDLPVEERVYAILETRQLITREYRDKSGKWIWLYMVYAADNRSSFHPPELCRAGANYEMTEKEKIVLTAPGGAVEVNSMLFEANNDRKELNYNWFVAGNRVCANYYQQQFFVLLDQLLTHKGIGAMVQISTPVYPDEEVADSHERLKLFGETILPSLMAMFES